MNQANQLRGESQHYKLLLKAKMYSKIMRERSPIKHCEWHNRHCWLYLYKQYLWNLLQNMHINISVFWKLRQLRHSLCFMGVGFSCKLYWRNSLVETLWLLEIFCTTSWLMYIFTTNYTVKHVHFKNKAEIMWLDDFNKNIYTITSFTTGLSLKVYKLKIRFPLKKMNEVHCCEMRNIVKTQWYIRSIDLFGCNRILQKWTNGTFVLNSFWMADKSRLCTFFEVYPLRAET